MEIGRSVAITHPRVLLEARMVWEDTIMCKPPHDGCWCWKRGRGSLMSAGLAPTPLDKWLSQTWVPCETIFAFEFSCSLPFSRAILWSNMLISCLYQATGHVYNTLTFSPDIYQCDYVVHIYSRLVRALQGGQKVNKSFCPGTRNFTYTGLDVHYAFFLLTR